MPENDRYYGQTSAKRRRPTTDMIFCRLLSSPRQPSHSYPARDREAVPLLLRNYLVKMICNERDGSRIVWEALSQYCKSADMLPGGPTSSCRRTNHNQEPEWYGCTL